MKKLAVALALLAAACASKPDATGGPAAPAGDPRLGELQTSMTELMERIDVLNDRVARLEQAAEQRVPATASTNQSAVQPPATRPADAPLLGSAPSARQTPAGVASRAVVNAQVADVYRNAIVLFGKNQLAASRAAFQQVYDSDPGGDLADNALFWIGETYFAAGKWSDAARFYKRVADDYAEQNKAPDALFKLALTYVKTGDLMLARTTLQDVVKRYPYSSTAASAKAELNRIKY